MSARRIVGLVLIVLSGLGLIRQLRVFVDGKLDTTGVGLYISVGAFVVAAIVLIAGLWLYTNTGRYRSTESRLLVCTVCGRASPPNSRHCGYCGGPLRTAG